MKKFYLALSILLGNFLFAYTVQAATVEFFIDGTLALSYGPDAYDLAGADISWTFSYDTTATDVGTGSTGDTATATYDALSVGVDFSNRPNSASDVSLTLDPGGFFNTNNVFSGSGADSLGTRSGSGNTLPDNGSGSGGLAGLLYSDFVFEFSGQNFFTGMGFAALPVIDNSDINTIFTPAIEDEFFSTGYEFDSLGITVTNDAVVPVPAALWLFGSGLLGLIGVSRRSRSV